MKKVVFLGAKQIGFECLKILQNFSQKYNYMIVAVLTNNRGTQIKEYALKHQIRILNDLDEYLGLDEVDIAISIQYHQILKPLHINKARLLNINLHMAPLPEYRGCNQFSYAIINQEDFFGTTIHILNEGIDAGDILFEDRFAIPNNIWVSELYDLTFKKSIELFKNNLHKIINLDIQAIPQKSLLKSRKCELHYREEIEKLKKIDLMWDKDKIHRHIRATYMPEFEPPYCVIHNEKIYMSKSYK